MRSRVWIAAALLWESGSWLITIRDSGRAAPGLFALLHGAAALCAALGLAARLPKEDRFAPWDVALLFSFGFFIPVAGVPLLWLGAARGLRPVPVPDDGPGWRLWSLPDLPPSAARAGRPSLFTNLNLAAAIRRGREPAQRLRAVLAAGRLRDPTGVALLAEALKDSDDEVRLLAYALLDRTEREIYARIKSAEAELEKAGEAQQAGLHASVAQHYFDLVWLGLARGDVAAHLLATAGRHAEESLKLAPGDGGTQVLLGRILLERGSLDEAEAAFGRALACGLGEPVVRPYLAEVAFRRRDFGAVKEQVEALAGGAAVARRLAAYWS